MKGKCWGRKGKRSSKNRKRNRAKNAKKIGTDVSAQIPANGKKGIVVPKKTVKKEPRRKSMNQERLTTMLSSKVLDVSNGIGSKGLKIKSKFSQIVEKSGLSQQNLDVNTIKKILKITPRGSNCSGVHEEGNITTKSSVSAVTNMFMKSPRTGHR